MSSNLSFARSYLLLNLLWQKKINVACFILSALIFKAAEAKVMREHKGRLVNSQGQGVLGPVDLEILLFRQELGGDPLLPSAVNFSQVSLNDGAFQILLELSDADSVTVFGARGDAPVWLQILDQTNDRIYPRQRMTEPPEMVTGANRPLETSTAQEVSPQPDPTQMPSADLNQGNPPLEIEAQNLGEEAGFVSANFLESPLTSEVTAARVEVGTSGRCGAEKIFATHVLFSKKFVTAPRVFLSPGDEEGPDCMPRVSLRDAAGFSWGSFSGFSGSYGCRCVHWMAVGRS